MSFVNRGLCWVCMSTSDPCRPLYLFRKQIPIHFLAVALRLITIYLSLERSLEFFSVSTQHGTNTGESHLNNFEFCSSNTSRDSQVVYVRVVGRQTRREIAPPNSSIHLSQTNPLQARAKENFDIKDIFAGATRLNVLSLAVHAKVFNVQFSVLPP